jgi:hypothetical protein
MRCFVFEQDTCFMELEPHITGSASSNICLVK